MRSERLGAQTRLCLSVSPFHLHVSTTQVCAPSRDFPPSRPSSVTPPKGMSWTLTRPLSEWGPQCPSSPHRSKSRRGDTVLLANAGVQKGSGLSINDGFTVQYAHVARGVARGGGGNSVPHGARWRRPSMRFFNGGAERGALGGLAGGVPSRSPTRSRRGQNGGDGRRRRDGGHFWFTTSTSPSPRTLADPRTGLSRLSRLSAPVAIVISPGVVFHDAPSVRRSRCLPGAVPVSTRWVPGGDGEAHGGRVATTQCCANHVVLPHLTV